LHWFIVVLFNRTPVPKGVEMHAQLSINYSLYSLSFSFLVIARIQNLDIFIISEIIFWNHIKIHTNSDFIFIKTAIGQKRNWEETGNLKWSKIPVKAHQAFKDVKESKIGLEELVKVHRYCFHIKLIWGLISWLALTYTLFWIIDRNKQF